MNETFGQRLSRIRKEKGMTQEDIAKRIVISPQAVSKWENDVSSPDILVLSSLADILGVSVDELLGREESAASSSNNSYKEEKKEEEIKSEVVDDEERINEEGVRIDHTGIHIHDKDGSHVDIDSHEVHATDHKGQKVDKKKFEHSKHIIPLGSLMGLAIIGYILMGLLWTDQGMGWKTGWTLFLFAIAFDSIFEAIYNRKICAFAYPVFIVAIYCLLGFLGLYHNFPGFGFYWFLFLTIPAFYMIFGPIDKNILHSKDEDDDDDDDD